MAILRETRSSNPNVPKQEATPEGDPAQQEIPTDAAAPAAAAPAAAAQPAPATQPAPAAAGNDKAGADQATAQREAFAAKDADLKRRWIEAQAQILDDPRESAKQVDALIQESLNHFNEVAMDARQRIHGFWSNDTDLSTDELRTTIQQYRRVFQHALAGAAATPVPELGAPTSGATTSKQK